MIGANGPISAIDLQLLERIGCKGRLSFGAVDKNEKPQGQENLGRSGCPMRFDSYHLFNSLRALRQR